MNPTVENAGLRQLQHRSPRYMNLAGASVALLVTALLTAALHARVGGAVAEQPRQPLAVPAARFTTQDSFRRDVSFLGLIRAGRKSRVGFEVPGAIATLPVTEGSVVVEGDILASLDTAQLQARRGAVVADIERVRAELELARIKARRQQDLKKTGAVSEEAFDETRLRARALEAQLLSVEAQLLSIDIDLEKSVLRAPYAGVVAQRLVNTGAVVNPGTPVVQLVSSDTREAHIGIAAEQTSLLTDGVYYRLKLRGQEFSARLRSVRPDVDPATLTTTAVFELPSGIGGLDGEPLSLVLEQEVEVSGGWLPVSALLEGERGLWTVLRLEETAQGVITVREVVEVLAVNGDRAYVRGTLSDAQRYVSDGVHRVAAGTPVLPLEA
jgi:RND family efflux transporter MFP subunit